METQPTVLRALRYRRRQYDGVRAAAQFITPFLQNRCGRPPRGATETDQQRGCSVPAFESAALRERLGQQLMGVPPSIAHEGPLAQEHLRAFSTIQHGELARLLQDDVAMRDSTTPPPSSHLSHMWPNVLQKYYAEALQNARETKASKVHPPHRVEAGLAALDVMRTACEKIYTTALSQTLAQRWRSVIDDYTLFLPDRSPHHELKNLPQEIGLGELLASLLDRRGALTCVIDVGGGNGFLATQLAERLDCASIVIDPFTPRHAIDNVSFPHWGELPRRRAVQLRRRPMHRIALRVADVSWDNMQLNLNTGRVGVDFDSSALVAKHLCGTAVDECFGRLAACGRLPRFVVVVPCCFNKGSIDSYCNPAHLSSIAGVRAAPSWDRWTRLTDWNWSAAQEQKRQQQQRRRQRRTKMHEVLPCMHDVAGLVETVINDGRLMWLREMGYDANIVTYVPHCVTPKNRAIIAVRR